MQKSALEAFKYAQQNQIAEQLKQAQALLTDDVKDTIAQAFSILKQQNLIRPRLWLTKNQEVSQAMKALDTIKSVQKTLFDKNLQRSLLPTLDSMTAMSRLFQAQVEDAKQFRGLVIELPYQDINRTLTAYSMFHMQVKGFQRDKRSDHDYILETTTSHETKVGKIELLSLQELTLKVSSMEEDIVQMKQFQLEDSHKKDEMLEELLDYFRKGGSGSVIIKNVLFNHKTGVLGIDGHSIPIESNSHQFQLCQVLFASNKSVSKVWQVGEIVDAFGELIEGMVDYWTNRIYHTIRHINNKIAVETGMKKFIWYENQTVMINPKYRSLTS